MQRTATVTAPTSFSAVAANSLYGLLKALGAAFIPADSILPDRCCGLRLITPASNTGTVQFLDRSNQGGDISIANARTVVIERQEVRNIIDLNNIFPVGSAANQTLTAVLDYT